MFVHRVLLALALVMAASGQIPPQSDPTHPPPEPKLPDGRSQREAILKDDFEKSLKDAADLNRLTGELQEELEKNDRHVLSMATLRKLDDIEKLTKRIRGRLKRY